ncbi:MAG: hypothetical protein ACI97B_003698 [Verrucomicrobiales bacterium]|jgi:uncharacterized protein (DUF58 family)
MAVLSKYIQPEVLAAMAHSNFNPRQLVEGTLAGAHKSPFHGFAVEFASHREYVAGDDLRHLDWNVYYRHHKHMIKQYEMETNLVCHLMLDVSSSMRFGEEDSQKMMYAARMAVTLAYLIVNQSDRVSLTTFDEKVIHSLPPSNSNGQIVNMSEMLDKIEPTKKTKIGPSMMELAGRAGRRGIVVVLSDFFVDLEDLKDALQRLRYDKHEVVLMQVLHNDEIEFNLPGMVRFVGLEEDEQFLTRPDDVRTAYLEAMNAFNDELESICEANQCERLVCDTSRSMAEMFADYLHARSLNFRRM